MTDGQFHFDPDTYMSMIRTEVPDYDTLQSEVGRAVREWNGTDTPQVLDLGAGTGSTSQAVLAALPGARLVLFDENPGMVAIAQSVLPPANVAHVVIANLSDPLPAGPFDLVVSALAIHHLDGAHKQALFTAVHDRLPAGGRFAMADVVIPDDADERVTPLTDDYDKPDRAADLLTWLRAAGFSTECVWARRDLAVFVSDKPS